MRKTLVIIRIQNRDLTDNRRMAQHELELNKAVNSATVPIEIKIGLTGSDFETESFTVMVREKAPDNIDEGDYTTRLAEIEGRDI